MAGGRARSNKRSSNSTCSTTVTTIIIAAMCVMGLWLLSPGSITSPLSTTRAAIAASTTTTAAGESNEVVQKSPVFEDSEENLPAMNAVMGSQRLSFPSKVFDLVQCARCRIPWHANGGVHLLEVDRVLRPGGFFVWSETPLTTCIHRVPTQATERGTEWPEEWPHRLETPPYWLSKSQTGVYGKPAPEDFAADYEHWKQVVRKLEVWVMNVVNTDSTDTLPIIFERGLLGIRHDWCESFSTYPRTYDLLHADHLFSAKYS